MNRVSRSSFTRLSNLGLEIKPLKEIGTNGSVLNHHRKIMPINTERTVLGMGDASGHKVVGEA